MPFDPLDPTVTEALRSWRVQEGAGVALEKTLATAARSCAGFEAQLCFIEASKRAAAGASPVELIGALEPILPPAERAVLTSGFRAGRLDRMLDYLVAKRELWHKARRQIRSKMILPVGILVAASFIAPFPAFILGGNFFVYAICVAIPLGIAFFAWRTVATFIRARQFSQGAGENAAPESGIDNTLLSIPLVARFERLRNLCEFTSVLGHLTGAGVLLSESLGVCASILPNGRYRSAAARLADGARSGRRLSEGLSADQTWPTELNAALTVGEETGTLEEACLRMANTYRDDYQRTVELLADWLPRILYALVALFVIFSIAMLVIQVAGAYQNALSG
jgi:type II secretory pathway component PulF